MTPEQTGSLQAHRGIATRFKPGQSGNPAGRPKGARSSLSESFLAMLAKDFAEHGIEALQTAREQDPMGYVKVVASLIPKELEVSGPGGGEIQSVLRVEFVRVDQIEGKVG